MENEFFVSKFKELFRSVLEAAAAAVGAEEEEEEREESDPDD